MIEGPAEGKGDRGHARPRSKHGRPVAGPAAGEQDGSMDLHPKQASGRANGRGSWWGGLLIAACLAVAGVAGLMAGGAPATAQSVSERQRLVQWERRRTEAAEKRARAAEEQADAAERAARAAEAQARALENVVRRLDDIERACGRR